MKSKEKITIHLLKIIMEKNIELNGLILNENYGIAILIQEELKKLVELSVFLLDIDSEDTSIQKIYQDLEEQNKILQLKQLK
jgi:uridine kinase